jgi:hypothetical protein
MNTNTSARIAKARSLTRSVVVSSLGETGCAAPSAWMKKMLAGTCLGIGPAKKENPDARD